MNEKVYEKVTNEIIKIIESTGKLPWERGWNGSIDGLAVSYATGKAYNFLNQFMLGFNGGEWITFNECKKLGGRIKKGAEGHLVYGCTMVSKDKEQEDGTIKHSKFFIYKYSYVFNVETDCEGVKPKHLITKEEKNEFVASQEADALIATYVNRSGVDFISRTMAVGFECPHYCPSIDQVVVPLKTQFKDSNEYYGTTFHELVHSTLKEDRCNRKSENELSVFGNEQYSKEELVAELGSAMIMSRLGLSSEKKMRNSAAYLKSWLTALKNDNSMLISAASKAQKAVEFIFGDVAERTEVA